MSAGKLGLHDGIPDAVYRSAQGLSASEAKILLGKRPPAPSPALAFGTLFHTLVLEPDRAGEYLALDAEKIGVKADGSKAENPTMTNAWKKAVKEAEQDGKTVVAQTDWDAACAMRDAVYAHKAAAEVMDLCTRHEVSGWAEHETGALVKGRIDLLGPGVVADLKSTKDADPERFGWTCADFMYHVSAADYRDIAMADGESVEAVIFINAEKEPPYRVSVVDLAPRAIDLGRDRMTEACRRWLDLGTVQLPSYGDGYHRIDLPPKAYSAGYADYTEFEGIE
ncbi:MAG: PD-(D/E)XK nuclease-like domain-containing protein [Nocardioidaceae bacterium]|nr:MAG: PD-(D/E)XK nuclease-like domain-containing protein [Nocardioidaceae bacterium]